MMNCIKITKAVIIIECYYAFKVSFVGAVCDHLYQIEVMCVTIQLLTSIRLTLGFINRQK